MINFNEYTKLVYFVFEKHFKQYQSFKDDLCQEGLIALWKAQRCFNQSKNISFKTFAYASIKNNMLSYLKRKELKHFKVITFSELEKNKVNIENTNCVYNDIDLDFKNTFNNNLKKTSIRNRQIIKDYFLSNKNQKQIASKYQISQPQVTRITQNFKINVKNDLLKQGD
jgi:RNA polymerase sigma factor (sigma-70 family)